MMYSQSYLVLFHCGTLWDDLEGTGGLDPPPPAKSQVAIGFLRNIGTDLPREVIGPLRSNCFSREVSTALCKIRW